MKNGVAAFQQTISQFIKEKNLSNTYAYLNNVTAAGSTQLEHDRNVKAFIDAIRRRNFTLNENKTISSVSDIKILGYVVGNKCIKPDPERMKPLLNIPPPDNFKALRRVLGMFAYYAKWISSFADKVPFTVECDASDIVVSVTLNQGGRPVAFMSRTLQGSKRHYPAFEKEATAVIEAVRKWSHLLSRNTFTLVTDQRSVSFMFDSRRRTKIKNDKVQQWRMELASFSYVIQYRPGQQNVRPDTFTRAVCATNSDSLSSLQNLHEKLCHPGITRMLHFVRTKILPLSTTDVKQVVASCKIFAEVKPVFFRQESGVLIKSTQPLKRISIDFKGPLPSSSVNKYLLIVVDEYSRFLFAFPCKDMTTWTVTQCLDQIFILCGTPTFVHSDNAPSFCSHEFKTYLTSRGISSSKSSIYYPAGNGQAEKTVHCMENNSACLKILQSASFAMGVGISRSANFWFKLLLKSCKILLLYEL